MANSYTLDDAGRDAVTQAVTQAERGTAGEIVTILTDRSDDYGDIALAWSAIVAFAALAMMGLAPDFYLGLIDRVLGTWRVEWSAGAIFELAAIVAILKFGAMWLFQLWQPLKFWLIPAAIKSYRVRQRAIAAFRIGAERRTHGRTGILIYLSMQEHRAEIVADEAIASKVDPSVWGDAMAAMIKEVREGRVAEGMVAAVQQVGVILARHVPRKDDDVDELPDRLIEI